VIQHGILQRSNHIAPGVGESLTAGDNRQCDLFTEDVLRVVNGLARFVVELAEDALKFAQWIDFARLPGCGLGFASFELAAVINAGRLIR
jgi:hypothetical protein